MSQILTIEVTDEGTGRTIKETYDNHAAFLARFTALKRDYEIVTEETHTRVTVRRNVDLFSATNRLYAP